MSAPPPSLAVQCTPPPPPPPPSQPPPCVASVPTYEIVTSCQPSVMYSNGYYYTSFAPPPPPPPAPTSSTGTPSTPTSTQPLAYSSVVANSQQVMPAPQYSAVAAGQPVQYTGTSTGAQVQQYTGTSTGAQVQYSSGTSPVQYSTTSSSVQYSPASTVQYTTSTPIVQYTTTCPLPQQQYSTVRLFDFDDQSMLQLFSPSSVLAGGARGSGLQPGGSAVLLVLVLLCSSSPTSSWSPDPVDHNSPGGSPAQLVIHGWWHQPASSTLPTSPKHPLLRLALRLLLPCSALALCLVHQGLVLVQGLVH